MELNKQIKDLEYKRWCKYNKKHLKRYLKENLTIVPTIRESHNSFTRELSILTVLENNIINEEIIQI